MTTDIYVTDQGTILRFESNTDKGEDWVREHVIVLREMGTPQMFYADHRPARDIVEAMRAAGLVVKPGLS